MGQPAAVVDVPARTPQLRVRRAVRLAMTKLVASVAWLLVTATPAWASGLHFRLQTVSPSPAVASGDAAQMAYLTTPTSLAVRTAGRGSQQFVVPAGCQ